MNKYLKMVSLVIAGSIIVPAAQAQVAGGVLGAPAIAAGGVLGAGASAHVPLSNTVGSVVPQATPTTESVTHSLAELSAGTTGTGAAIQQNGIGVLPSATTGRPVVSVGSPNPATQGSVAAVANGALR